MTLTLTVHRGTQQIGGSCIEITHPQGDRIILDAGQPLDAPDGATGLLPASLDRSRPATVLISHPHQDHWGLVEELPATWLVWTGSGSAKLIAGTGDVMRRSLSRTFETWESRSGPQVPAIVPMVAAGFGVSMVPASIRQIHAPGARYLDIPGEAPRAR